MYMPSPYRMLVRRFIGELEAGELTETRAARLVASEGVVHVPGSGRLAGEYRGPAGFARLFGLQREAAQDGFDLQLQSYDVHDSAAAAVVTIGARRDMQTYRDRVRLVLSFEGGKIKELWLDPVDAAGFDAFFH
jgi:ketosteroid isomerase-like protein